MRFGQGLIQSLINPGYAGNVGNIGVALGQRAAGIPQAVAAEAAQQRQQQEQQRAGMLSAYQLGAAPGGADPVSALGDIVQGTGIDPAEAVKMMQAGQTQAATQQKEQMAQQERDNLAKAKTVLAKRAEDLGLPGVAKQVRTASTGEQLKNIAQDIRDLEMKRVPLQSPGVRRSMAQQAGITPRQFADLGLANVSDEEFKAYLSGQKAESKPWMTADGIKIFRENEYGRVLDEETNVWVDPNEAGLTAAPPSVQKVETVANTLAGELSKAGAKSFTELHGKAVTAQTTLNNINEVLPILDESVITGFAANERLFMRRVAAFLGDDPEDVVNTEQYIAMAATRVADIIQAFGAGTGLSDADREYAQKAAAGDITMNAESMRRLLKILKKGSENVIQQFNDTKSSVRKTLNPDDKGAVEWFQLPPAVQQRQTVPEPPKGFVRDR